MSAAPPPRSVRNCLRFRGMYRTSSRHPAADTDPGRITYPSRSSGSRGGRGRHRVVDGALGAELLAAFKALVENPVRMLV